MERDEIRRSADLSQATSYFSFCHELNHARYDERIQASRANFIRILGLEKIRNVSESSKADCKF